MKRLEHPEIQKLVQAELRHAKCVHNYSTKDDKIIFTGGVKVYDIFTGQDSLFGNGQELLGSVAGGVYGLFRKLQARDS